MGISCRCASNSFCSYGDTGQTAQQKPPDRQAEVLGKLSVLRSELS